MYVDIDLLRGANYGASLFWDEVPHGYEGAPWREQAGGQKPLPPPGTRVADVLWDVDVPGFEELFIGLMTRPKRR